MQSFYRERFANAADFTYFFVGAFTDGRDHAAARALGGVAAVDREEDLDVHATWA